MIKIQAGNKEMFRFYCNSSRNKFIRQLQYFLYISERSSRIKNSIFCGNGIPFRLLNANVSRLIISLKQTSAFISPKLHLKLFFKK